MAPGAAEAAPAGRGFPASRASGAAPWRRVLPGPLLWERAALSPGEPEALGPPCERGVCGRGPISGLSVAQSPGAPLCTAGSRLSVCRVRSPGSGGCEERRAPCGGRCVPGGEGAGGLRGAGSRRRPDRGLGLFVGCYQPCEPNSPSQLSEIFPQSSAGSCAGGAGVGGSSAVEQPERLVRVRLS